MKFRETVMPDEQTWNSFFDPLHILRQMEINKVKTLMDIGCGYGTFLVPAAKLVESKVIGIDIEKAMIDVCKSKMQEREYQKIGLVHGDILTSETLQYLQQYKGQVDYITLFNILHCEQPLELLTLAYSILADNGKIGVIHWKYGNTPVGPSMEIRPTPALIYNWALEVGFASEKYVELPPYHYGMVFMKKRQTKQNRA
jgi:ubiquinone/menaquinone biosynthesis C-methylase UbiE